VQEQRHGDEHISDICDCPMPVGVYLFDVEISLYTYSLALPLQG